MASAPRCWHEVCLIADPPHWTLTPAGKAVCSKGWGGHLPTGSLGNRWLQIDERNGGTMGELASVLWT